MGQGLGAILLVIMTFLLLTNTRPGFPVLDEANLLIHESGHVFFGTMGIFIGILGGSLMQIGIPLAAVIYFKYTKQLLATTFTLFWLGESLINLSLYIKDARTMLLPLVNGGIHDWNFILDQLHLLNYDQILGNTVYFLGLVICISGSAWAVLSFLKNSKQLTTKDMDVLQKKTFYGKEKKSLAYIIGTMNMILHNNPSAEITKGQSTLSNPLFLDANGRLKTFDFVVANPPFSYKSWSNGFAVQSQSYMWDTCT